MKEYERGKLLSGHILIPIVRRDTPTGKFPVKVSVECEKVAPPRDVA